MHQECEECCETETLEQFNETESTCHCFCHIPCAGWIL